MKKLSIVIFMILSIIVFILFLQRKPESLENFPTLQLKGGEEVHVEIGKPYIEEGYLATDKKDGDLTKKVVIKEDVNYQKAGIYKKVYKVTNSKKETTKRIRTIIVNKEKNLTYQENYEKEENKKKGWWSGNKKDGTRPLGGADEKALKKYRAYFMGSNTKTIYLTFDEGDNDTYVKEIADVLDRHKVKATFFLCKRFILDNPDLIRSMTRNGHSIGNHTAYHKSMPKLATKQNFSTYLKEITDLEDAYYSVTGKQIDKVYREPKGEWSYRSLKIVKDLGYKSFFYSADYLDWKGTVTKEYALKELKKRVHNGAIYLIHPKNKGNYQAMDSFIKEMKKEGYSFDLVKNIT
ncbi:MAG: polysaccharide deacetylase family protein [Bacilli bacterium]|nr:polysaccharide deacetylase family protein [Bacilli bacterium]